MTPIIKHEHAYNQAYEILRKMIMTGELPLGQKLVEEKLAALLGVSRTPVRESLRRLEQDGLVQGKHVIQPAIEDLKDIYELRMLIEGYACAHAAKVGGEKLLLELKQHIEVNKKGTKAESAEASTAFHHLIVEFTENQYMIDAFSKTEAIILLFRYQSKFQSSSCKEHEQIYEAIEKGEADRAEDLMKSHLQENLQRLIEGYPF
ncbi:GntR family transcriptional regulator [Metabacillus sp. RGM 3146]|uniref:GntR family transcriptional regulator n=1 Tax=Metabacillus sp. RGM 3146 TaxID=3401092 RepID=UPI003B9D688F